MDGPELIDMLVNTVNELGASTVVIILIAALGIFWLQRKRVKNIIWDYVEGLEEKGELDVADDSARDWVYTFYGMIPLKWRSFMTRKMFEGIVDMVFAQVLALIPRKKDLPEEELPEPQDEDEGKEE